MLNKVVNNNHESTVPLIDRLPFFDISINSISNEDYGDGLSLVNINNNVNVIVQKGLVGVLTKRDNFRLYYELSDKGYPEVVIMLRK